MGLTQSSFTRIPPFTDTPRRRHTASAMSTARCCSRPIPAVRGFLPKFLDGIEVYNGNPRHESNNPRARAWAEEHHLLFSSGSDYHETEDVARGGMIFPGEIHNSKELAAALAKGVGELIET